MVRRIYNVSNKPAEPRTPQRHDHGGQPAEHTHDTIQMACDCDDRMLAMEARIAELEARQPAREVVKVESTAVERLPQEYVDQLASIARDLERFKQSQEFVMPKAFAEAVERISALEQRPIDITPAQTDTTIVEQVAALREDVEALQDNRDAHRAMIETAAGFSDIARQIMRKVDENRARANAQFGVAMDHVKELSETIRGAIG